MPERCRIFVPVSKGNRGNNNKKTSLKKQVAEILNLIFFLNPIFGSPCNYKNDT
jgi:hypothetical protein